MGAFGEEGGGGGGSLDPQNPPYISHCIAQFQKF